MAFTLADLKKAQGITVTPKSSGSNFKLSDVKAAIAKPAQTTSQTVTPATFPKTTVKASALFNPVTNPIPANNQPIAKQEPFQPLQKTLAQTPPTPSPYTTEHPETISKTGDEILKFAAKTGVATLNILSSGLDFATDLVAKNLVTKKENPQSILQPKFITNLNDKWLKWYNEKEANGEIYSQKIQKFVDTLSQSEYVQNRPEWEALDTKQKLSKENIGETILNLAPSVIASVATFAVNPTFGFVVSASSTAQDVKEGAVKAGVDPQKAEKLGLATGLIVGFLDKIVPDEVFNNKETKQFFIKEFLKNLVRRTVTEAGTEIAQEDIQMIVEQTFKTISDDEKEQRRVMAGLGGALGGSGFSILGDFSNITVNEDILEKNPSGTTPSTINSLTEESVPVETEEVAPQEEATTKETPKKTEVVKKEEENLITATKEDYVLITEPVATRGEKQKVSPAVKKLAKKLGVSLDNKYSPSKNRSQITRANKFYNSNPRQAIEVALGLRTPPAGILEEAIRIVAEDRAIKSGDTQQLIDIARADVLSGRRTAQELQIRAAREPLSPINLIGSVLAEKQKRVEKKTGKTTKKLIKEETVELKDSITKTQPKVRDWTSFLEEIKCK